MTDERMGEHLWRALHRLPSGSGVVFRHHATPPAERRSVLRRVRRIAHARRLVLLVAGLDHGRRGRRPTSHGVHDRREAVAAAHRGATILFVSPVHATRSHPGARPLGATRAARIGRGLGTTVVALGGMDARRWRRIRQLGFDGWAAIDAWLD